MVLAGLIYACLLYTVIALAKLSPTPVRRAMGAMLLAMGLVETDLQQEQVGPLVFLIWYNKAKGLMITCTCIQRHIKEVCVLQNKHLFTRDDCTFTHIYPHRGCVSCRLNDWYSKQDGGTDQCCMGIGLLMAYFHWSILNLATLPESLWRGKRRSQLLQTWLAPIPRFPHYLLRWFPSLKNEMVLDFNFSSQVLADVTLSYLFHSSEESVTNV